MMLFMVEMTGTQTGDYKSTARLSETEFNPPDKIDASIL